MKSILKLGAILLILISLLAAGCVDNQETGNEDIELAISLMSIGESFIDEIDDNYPTDTKNKLAAAEVSYTEALEILNNASGGSEDEIKLIETNKLICEYTLDNIEGQKNLVECYVHLRKARAYLNYGNYDKARDEVKLLNNSIDAGIQHTKNAKDKVNGIDVDEVPVELKPILIHDRATIEDEFNAIPELESIMIGLTPLIDGLEHFDQGLDYLDNGDWELAEDEFSLAAPDFSESKAIFEDLQDSDFEELSLVSIEVYNLYEDAEKISEYCAEGCRYMSEGQIFRADDEFEKAVDLMGSASFL